MKPSKLSEKAFMAQVVQLARLTGWLVYHTHDSRRSASGFPDLLLLRGERCIVAELKVADNEASIGQLAWLAAFRRAGIPAYVWRPADFDDEIQRVLAVDPKYAIDFRPTALSE